MRRRNEFRKKLTFVQVLAWKPSIPKINILTGASRKKS